MRTFWTCGRGVLVLIVAGAVAVSAAAQTGARQSKHRPGKPHPSTTADERLSVLDRIFNQAVEERQIPGAVVLVGHDGKAVFRKAYGYRSLEPRREAMTLDTIFDMASLTKCMVTAVAVMQLVQNGQVRLNETVAHYLPEFGANGKQEITVRQLLTHYAGLPDDLDLKAPWRGRDAAFRMAMDTTPVYTPGSRFFYSDVNYEVLGFLVERVSGMALGMYASERIFQPLGMEDTTFLPPASWRTRIAPTEYDERGQMLRGVVHDPTARRMGGVAGHAGVFSTANDLAKFAQAMLDGGAQVLSPLMVEKMTTPQQPPNATSVHGFGWDIDTPFSSNRGDLLPVGSFGHTGYTGTSLWVDPVTRTYIIILANAVHPRGQNRDMVSLRNRAATAVAAALKFSASEEERMRLARITGYNDSQAAARRINVRNGQVKTGIDVLELHNFDRLRAPEPGKIRRIGLLTNQTGLDGLGRRTIDVLAHVDGIKLAAIFSPEHGVTGALDTFTVSNTVDAATGVPVYSVYGDTDAKRHPPLDIMKDLDAVVYDVQDAGARFYTYETTLGYLLEAAAKTGTEVVVLDRPNPVTGSYVQGPVSQPGQESFVNYTQEPVRHGMTVGELAKMFNAERHINARLTVITMEGWMRGDWYDSTGLMWINPSPNLRSLTQATLYPGVAMIEGTNVSVGRGTDTPFEVVGAPWIKAKAFADHLNARAIQGVRFIPTSFTPAAGAKFGGQKIGGVNIVLLNRNTLDAPELGIELASALHKLYPNEWDMRQLDLLVNDPRVVTAIAADGDARNIADDWREDLERFEAVRKKYLLY
jgi:uncharacterized protein YbbC (DUF1343 family)/CubicO group peptidase (beta-lactamase class C family)